VRRRRWDIVHYAVATTMAACSVGYAQSKKLIVVHAIGGAEITISPRHVTSMRAAHPENANELLIEHVNCVIGLDDGRFVSVVEECADIRKALEDEP
jgi:hypothetical protein